MRAIAMFSLVIVLSACSPAPTPSQSPAPSPTSSAPSPTVAAGGAFHIAVVNVDPEVRTVGLVLVGRVEKVGGEVVADLGQVRDGSDVSLASGSYRFVGETHAFGVSGMASDVQGRCDRTFAVQPAETTALTVEIAWGQPCSIAGG